MFELLHLLLVNLLLNLLNLQLETFFAVSVDVARLFFDAPFETKTRYRKALNITHDFLFLSIPVNSAPFSL